jgi:hypothetical protein
MNPYAEINDQRTARAIKHRRALLAHLPEQFLLRDAVALWGKTPRESSALIQKMARHHEIEAVTTYQKPRVYRKCSQSAA